jgi:hypothetical protein
MTKHPPSAISGGDWIFCVTPNGKAHVDEHSPKPPKVSRSKARYLAWLDADCGMKFGEWIRSGR